MAYLYSRSGSQLSDGSLDGISEFLQDAAVQVSESIASAHQRRLFTLGQNTVASGINEAMTDMGIPKDIRVYLQPDYTPPPPTPQWVSDALAPLIKPITAGAKYEGIKVARRLAKPLFVGGFFAILTLFGIGYMVGRSSEEKNKRELGSR